MSKYIVKPVVCDYGIFIVDDDGNEELVEVCNSQVNANTICEIFNADLMKDGQYAIWKDDKIADLELKLAESEKPKEIRFNGFVIDCNYDEARNNLQKEILKMQEENNELRKSQELQTYAQNILEINQLKQQLAEKDAELIGRKKLCDLRYKQLQNSHQDKISFAIEQLLDIKEEVFGTREMGIIFDIPPVQDAFDVIENKIEQLNASNSMPLKEEDKQ